MVLEHGSSIRVRSVRIDGKDRLKEERLKLNDVTILSFNSVSRIHVMGEVQVHARKKMSDGRTVDS